MFRHLGTTETSHEHISNFKVNVLNLLEPVAYYQIQQLQCNIIIYLEWCLCHLMNKIFKVQYSLSSVFCLYQEGNIGLFSC